jgi:hypothetical protein
MRWVDAVEKVPDEMGGSASVWDPIQPFLRPFARDRSRNAGDGFMRHSPPDVFCEGFQVLHDGGEVEFVARTREAPQAHALEAVVGLEVRKAHLDLLTLVA